MNVVTRTLRRSAGIRTVLRSPLPHATCALPSRVARAYSTPSSPSTAWDNLIDSLKSSKDIPSIHSSYLALATAIHQSNANTVVTSSPDNQEWLLDILKVLASSGLPEETRRIEEILTDLYPILGMKPSKSFYTSILQAFVDGLHIPQARNFLLKLPQFPGQFLPDIEQFHIIIEGCNRLPVFNDLIADMQRLSCLIPTTQTFPIIFRTRGLIAIDEEEVPKKEEMTNLIEQCVQQGLTYDPVVADILYATYEALGRIPEASAILETYESVIRIFKDETPEEDVPAAEPDASHYFDVLKNCIDSGNIEEALRLCNQALEVGIFPSHTLLTPLWKAIIETSASADQYFDTALAFYRRLADAVGTDAPPTQNPHRRENPALGLYHSLIRILTASLDVARWSPVINDLLNEMKARGLPTDTQLTSVTMVILEMRRTGSFEDSMNTYRRYRPSLGEYGFVCILKEYCRISFAGDLQVPLITDFFSIVNDMRLARVPIKPTIYTLFLHSIGTTATRVYRDGGDEDIHERLVATTRRVHDFLTLEASVSPDPALWNQLMNTYQRLGCFAEACRLWDMMYLTGRYDQITVNIMLDACGFHPDLRLARSILNKVHKAGFDLDQRNWNTWIECLCRSERFDEAADVILFQMGKHRMKPDVQSLRILLKFMKRTSTTVQMEDIKRRIKMSLPHLWRRLPDEIQNP